MKAKGLDYTGVAKLAGLKNGNVIKTTVTRGLPLFAWLLVVFIGKLILLRNACIDLNYELFGYIPFCLR